MRLSPQAFTGIKNSPHAYMRRIFLCLKLFLNQTELVLAYAAQRALDRVRGCLSSVRHSRCVVTSTNRNTESPVEKRKL